MRQHFVIPLLALTVVASAQTTRQGIPGVQHKISKLRPAAIYQTGGNPDWMAVTAAAAWIADADRNVVFALDPASTRIMRRVTIANPCSGLTAGFGSLWVPSCGAHALFRVDLHSGKILAKIAVAPADSEGGVAAGAGSVWLPTKDGLARIDAATNKLAALVKIAAGSYAAAFGDDAVWITSTEGNLLTRVDARSNRVVATIAVGPQPRFLTVGAGSVWTLNQGDGTVSRVDMKTNRLVATIATGSQGHGGYIAFGACAVWTTIFNLPLTRIDPQVNRVTAQWTGAGGDSVGVSDKSLWLADYKGGTVSRFHLPIP